MTHFPGINECPNCGKRNAESHNCCKCGYNLINYTNEKQVKVKKAKTIKRSND